jgi:hypothetical protein
MSKRRLAVREILPEIGPGRLVIGAPVRRRQQKQDGGRVEQQHHPHRGTPRPPPSATRGLRARRSPTERVQVETALADLRIEKAKVDGERKAVEADLGPVRYLATLFGSTDEQTMRWFILIVALLLDPAAVLLLLAATHRGRQ